MKYENSDVWEVTRRLRWWKPSMTAILQQKWRNTETHEEKWIDVPIIREENEN